MMEKKFIKLTKKEKNMLDEALDELCAIIGKDDGILYTDNDDKTLRKLINKIGHRDVYIENLGEK